MLHDTEEKDAMSAVISHLYGDGIMMIHTGSAALSTAMDQAEIDRLCEAVQSALTSVRPILDKAA